MQHNFKKVTFGILVLLPLSCLLIFQSTSHSEPEIKSVTYRYTFAPLGDGVYYEKYIPGEDAPISLYFTFDLAPPQFGMGKTKSVNLSQVESISTHSKQTISPPRGKC